MTEIAKGKLSQGLPLQKPQNFGKSPHMVAMVAEKPQRLPQQLRNVYSIINTIMMVMSLMGYTHHLILCHNMNTIITTEVTTVAVVHPHITDLQVQHNTYRYRHRPSLYRRIRRVILANMDIHHRLLPNTAATLCLHLHTPNHLIWGIPRIPVALHWYLYHLVVWSSHRHLVTIEVGATVSTAQLVVTEVPHMDICNKS